MAISLIWALVAATINAAISLDVPTGSPSGFGEVDLIDAAAGSFPAKSGDEREEFSHLELPMEIVRSKW